MYTINVTWRGGPEWDPNEPGLFDPNKKKTPVEHLIETGAQTIEETYAAFSYFRDMPITLSQNKIEDPTINWVTTLSILSTNPEEAGSIRDQLLEHYERKKHELISSGSEYQITIDVTRT